ncbi:MAG: DMT family transporter [Alphaproteobacteria bacterium]|nr:DMT family transporter [Alphaproteobacteria bacterium]
MSRKHLSSMWKATDQNTARGIFLMCLTSVLSFPLLNTTVKYLVTDFSVWQIVWARALFHLGFMLLLFAPRMGIVGLFRTAHPVLQGLRSLLQFLAMLFYFSALEEIALPTATAIAFTAPLMVVAFSVPILGEKVGPRRWGAVIFGFLGALIIIRPGADVTDWATLYVLGSALCYAIYQILTRRVAARDDARTTAVYTVVAALIGASIVAPFDLVAPTLTTQWLAFAGLGLTGALGHLFLIKAYASAEASIISPFDYGQLIGATILGYLIWNDFPDLWTWIGAFILVLSGVYIARREAVRRPGASIRDTAK